MSGSSSLSQSGRGTNIVSLLTILVLILMVAYLLPGTATNLASKPSGGVTTSVTDESVEATEGSDSGDSNAALLKLMTENSKLKKKIFSLSAKLKEYEDNGGGKSSRRVTTSDTPHQTSMGGEDTKLDTVFEAPIKDAWGKPKKLPSYTKKFGFWTNDPYAAKVGITYFSNDYFIPKRIPEYDEKPVNWPLILGRCRHHIYAQGKQDGILLCIFAAIGHTNRFFVEFGHNNFYEANSATFYLLGWRGLFMDGGHPSDPTYNHHTEWISDDTICSKFKKHKVPKKFDYLSADIDSLEGWVLDSIFRCGYRPRVWSIEYNCAVPLDKNWTANKPNFPGWKGNCYYGISLAGAVQLAEHWGYKLVFVDALLDAFFVDETLLPPNVELPSLAAQEDKLCLSPSLHKCQGKHEATSKETGWVDISEMLDAHEIEEQQAAAAAKSKGEKKKKDDEASDASN